jgi:DNA-directed RNA polymerase II subunit RPB1
MEVMGFNPKWNRPEWMLCTVLLVPPPAVRPSIIEENGQRREDDLTHKLSDIIK